MKQKTRLAAMAMAVALLAWVLVATSASASAPTQIYVDNRIGDDGADGRHAVADGGSGPVRTFDRALKLAGAGAHIILANTGSPYRETFQIEGYGLGRAGAPLVIEGNGAIVSGLVDIPSDAWAAMEDGVFFIDAEVFRRVAPLGGMPKSNWLWHWKRQSWWHEPEAPDIFFLNGKAAPHAETLEAIEPGGFFYNVNRHPLRIHFRPPEGMPITACRVEVPANRGVIINDDHVVIRNLGSMYSSDDGFSTFLAAGAIFHNVYGAYNCDQGLSLHNATTGLIEGGLFERNGGCGIVDVMNTQSVYIQTVVRRNMVAGMWLAGSSHTVQSCYLVDNRGPQAVVVNGTRGNFINTVVNGQDAIDVPQIGLHIQGIGQVDHSTLLNCSTGVRIDGTAQVGDSIVWNCGEWLIHAPERAAGPRRTVLDPSGKIMLGKVETPLASEAGTRADAVAAWLKGVRLDAGLPERPLAGYPEGHPLSSEGMNNTRIGATLAPRDVWQPDVPVEIIPVTVFTHRVGRRRY